MGEIIEVAYGGPIDINIKLDNVKFEDLSIPTNLYIYKDNDLFLSFANGKGFSIIKINETEEVFVDIAIGETESLFEPGKYTWEISIKMIDGSIYKKLTGSFNIIDGILIKKERMVKPWDLLNDEKPKVSKEIKKERFDICKSCPEYSLGICKKCGCVMALKTMLAEAKCPIHKWENVTV